MTGGTGYGREALFEGRDVAEIADEFVMGLLDPAEEAAVEERAARDPALRAAIARSRDRFLELDAGLAPAPQAPGLWDRIEGALDAPAENGAAPANFELLRAERDAKRWRLSAVAAMAASLLLAVGLAALALRPGPAPIVVAVLLDPAGEPVAMIEDYGAAARLIPLKTFDVPGDRVMQVWTKYSEEVGPVSLGLLPRSSAQELSREGLPEPKESQLYEITLEAPGGSPTGRPTGPILAKGFGKAPRLP